MDNNIYVIYGNDGTKMIKDLLTRTNPFSDLDKNISIGLKPNLVVTKASETGATTDTEIIIGLIEFPNEECNLIYTHEVHGLFLC
ncbi:MAG: hypothetical protein QME46_08800 [Thermoanaerobacteraceae bacterium]|nr:hypothetical protein [Thermoanaerobacteraceae bacterium]